MLVKRQLAINLIAQIISFSINILINFFLTRFIVNKLGNEAYGYIGLSNNFIQYIEIFTVALNSMASRYITIKVCNGDYDEANRYFSTVFWGNIFISLLILPISFLVIFNLNNIINITDNLILDVKLLFYFIIINFIINLISSVFGITFFALNRLEITSITNALAYLIKAIILLILYTIFTPSIWFVGFSTLLGTLVILVVNKKWSKKLLSQLSISIVNFDWRLIVELISSGIWSSISKISAILSTGVDLLISNIFIGQIAMGIVSVSKTMPMMLVSLFTMLSNVFAPQLTIYYAQQRYIQIRDSLIFSMKIMSIFSSITLSIFIMLSKQIYTLWMPEQNADILRILSIITCIQLIFYIPLQPLNNVFPIVKKLRLPAICVLISGVLTVLLELAIIPVIGDITMKMCIIVLSSAIFELIRVVLFVPIYAAKCLKLKWTTFYSIPFKNLLIVLILMLVFRIILNQLSIIDWFDLILVAIIFVLIGIVFSVIIIFNNKERISFINKIKEKIKNFH